MHPFQVVQLLCHFKSLVFCRHTRRKRKINTRQEFRTCLQMHFRRSKYSTNPCHGAKCKLPQLMLLQQATNPHSAHTKHTQESVRESHLGRRVKKMEGGVSTCPTRLLSQLQHADDTNFAARPKESEEQRKDFQRLFSVHGSNNFICFVSFRFVLLTCFFLVSVGGKGGKSLTLNLCTRMRRPLEGGSSFGAV